MLAYEGAHEIPGGAALFVCRPKPPVTLPCRILVESHRRIEETRAVNVQLELVLAGQGADVIDVGGR